MTMMMMTMMKMMTTLQAELESLVRSELLAAEVGAVGPRDGAVASRADGQQAREQRLQELVQQQRQQMDDYRQEQIKLKASLYWISLQVAGSADARKHDACCSIRPSVSVHPSIRRRSRGQAGEQRTELGAVKDSIAGLRAAVAQQAADKAAYRCVLKHLGVRRWVAQVTAPQCCLPPCTVCPVCVRVCVLRCVRTESRHGPAGGGAAQPGVRRGGGPAARGHPRQPHSPPWTDPRPVPVSRPRVRCV